MPEHCVDHFDKLLVKSMDFCEFLATFSEDWKIKGISKHVKIIKSEVFHRLVCYNPVRSAGIVKLRRELTDKWF